MEVPSTATRVRKIRRNASTGLVDYLSLADVSPVNTVHHLPVDVSLALFIDITPPHLAFGCAREPTRTRTARADGWVTRTQHTQVYTLGGVSESTVGVVGT